MDTQIIRQQLQALGNTSQEVADNLRSKGIKGFRLAGASCPIAKYLSTLISEGCVMVGVKVVSYFPEGRMTATDNVDLPESVIHFIADFDRSKYPDMIQNGSI
jgi:hypothetical protein